MRRLRDHGLSIFFGAIFVLALVGQSIAGRLAHNADQALHGEPAVSWVSFVTSSEFVVDVAENWQSEYLQFFLFIAATVWLIERGHPSRRSRVTREPAPTRSRWSASMRARTHRPGPRPTDGAAVFSNSLLLVMGGVFVMSWLLQSLAGLTVYNAEQSTHGAAADRLGELCSRIQTSGTARCRTGSRSSSQSAAWWR